jgi:uncharacterized protein with GYD domain
MANYIMLGRFTDKGIATIKESPSRLDAVKDLFRTLGGQLKGFYLVTGQYDLICIVDVPNDEVLAKAVLTIGAKGNVKTETIRAFSEEEYRKIIGSLP